MNNIKLFEKVLFILPVDIFRFFVHRRTIAGSLYSFLHIMKKI